MNRIVVPVALAAFLLAPTGAHAQYGYRYPQGYGNYGWGGWGSSSGGNLARGLGAYNMGRGTSNELGAVANAIGTGTVANWNHSLYQSNRAGAHYYAAHLRYEMAKNNKDRAQIEDRLRNHPNPEDLDSGDALNVLLDVLLKPDTADRSIGQIKAPIKHDSILDIPFEFASEGMTVCLDRMTMEEQWPIALRGASFEADRQAVKRAVAEALKEDEQGKLEAPTIEAVRAAVARLQARFKAEVPTTAPDYYPARDAVKALSGLAKMLYSPEMDKILAELEDYQGTTLGDLLGFMQSFNLRFAPAASYRQRQIYRKLHAMMADAANGQGGGPNSIANSAAAAGAAKAGGDAARSVEKAGGDAIDGLKNAATDLFKGMKD